MILVIFNTSMLTRLLNSCKNPHTIFGFELWLKGPFLGDLSHGSKSNNWWIGAMAQGPIFDIFEPWLKPSRKN